LGVQEDLGVQEMNLGVRLCMSPYTTYLPTPCTIHVNGLRALTERWQAIESSKRGVQIKW